MENNLIHAIRFGTLAIWLLVLSCHYETKPDPSLAGIVTNIVCGLGSIMFLFLLVFAT